MSAAQHNPTLPAQSAAASRTWHWRLLWLLILVACLVPAMLNRGPPAFGDTQAYLATAQLLRPTHERAFGYGAFLRAAGGLVSLWLPAAVQAALVAYAAVRLLSLEAVSWPPRWRDWLQASAGRTLEQLGDFELGAGMDRAGLDQLAPGLRQIGLPDAARAVGRTRQAEDRLVPLMPRRLADALGAAGLLGLVALPGLGLARGRPEVWWPALLVLTAWLGNAALVALGGEVHGRYGARLVWVVPLLAGLVALRAWRVRRV